jgi:hypothetical protein
MEVAGVSSVQGINVDTAFTSRKNVYTDPYHSLKTGIWIYFILLVFEGSLRKWVLPGLASPLLLIRDPIAIWLIFISWKRGILIFNKYIYITCIVGIISLFTAIFFGHGSLIVAAYGVRTLVLHFILIFVIGVVFNRDDVLKIGKFMLWVSVPMSILLILQFYSPQSAWVNRGVGGDTTGGGFEGALGFFRPPGTFSFTNGVSLYYSLLSCYVFYFWLDNTKYINRVLLISASVALLMSIPLSISRTLVFSIAVILGFMFIAILKKRNSIKQVLIIVLVLLGISLVLSQLSIFKTATGALTTRFSNANSVEGGLQGTLGDRYLGGLLGAIINFDQLPFWGYGIGMGTNVGSTLLTGKSQFLFAEGEWGRLVGELGIVMGLIIIIIRSVVTFKIFWASYKILSIDFLPWLLVGYCVITVPQAQWAQPTALGFSVFVAGIAIASMRYPPQNTDVVVTHKDAMPLEVV